MSTHIELIGVVYREFKKGDVLPINLPEDAHVSSLGNDEWPNGTKFQASLFNELSLGDRDEYAVTPEDGWTMDFEFVPNGKYFSNGSGYYGGIHYNFVEGDRGDIFAKEDIEKLREMGAKFLAEYKPSWGEAKPTEVAFLTQWKYWGETSYDGEYDDGFELIGHLEIKEPVKL